ncbi:MAG: diversity-generating retroelement protein Avd [Spirochaetia bacterium]|nr:diversity-generating retroelement protein Avd [Spirochaetia bacterium]
MPAKEMRVIQKWEDMVDYGYIALKQYPKSEKFALAAETREAMWEIGTWLLRANAMRAKSARYKNIEKADHALARLRVLVRAGYRLRFLPPKKYEHWSGINVELGKLIGGWMSATNKGV